jgi:hypothetical protein
MTYKKFNPGFKLSAALVLLIATVRSLTGLGLQHLPAVNFTPIGAMALFGGAYFNRPLRAFLLPLLTLWISDLFLDRLVYFQGWKWFYPGFYWTYAAFALMTLTGRLLLKKIHAGNLLLACGLSVLIHWILTDYGDWLAYPPALHTWAGWWACLLVAIPYEGQLLASTLVYSALFFGVLAWRSRRRDASRIRTYPEIQPFPGQEKKGTL